MNAIIIEDEKLSAEHLGNLLKKIDSTIEILATFDSVKKSVEAFENGIKADVVFLDVHLADGLSFDIFTKTPLDIPVIFTTAFDEYAIKAFKLNSIDYLLKPIGAEELKASLVKLSRLNHLQQSTLMTNLSNAYQKLHKPYKSRFMVKMGDAIVSVKTEDIQHFIAEDGITLMHTNGKRYAVDYTLEQLVGLLAPELFFRINRKVVIHINAVQKVNAYFNSRLKISSTILEDECAVVSRERVAEFKAWLDQ